MRIALQLTLLLYVTLLSATSLATAADVTSDERQGVWSLTTGDATLQLRRVDDTLYLASLGPTGASPKPWQSPLFSAVIEGKPARPKDFHVESIRTERSNDSARVVARLKHASSPLEIELACIAWSDTGVFWTELNLNNTGKGPLAVQEISSLALSVPGDRSELRYLDGPAPSERQLKSKAVVPKGVEISNEAQGRSTRNISTWWSLYVPQSDLSYTSQLAYSGNWFAHFGNNGKTQTAAVNVTFDNDGPLRIAPGESFDVPPAAIVVTRGSDIDAGANALHRFQRRHIIPRQPTNDPLLVEFNTWYAFSDKIDAENINRVLPLAAQIGCEAFVIDAGWFTSSNGSERWNDTLGDWDIDRRKFPDGLAPIIKSAHDHGLKFGLWLEPEVASPNAEILREHPEWFFHRDGKVLIQSKRAHLDFSQPAVRAHMQAVLERLMQEGSIEWFKFDYNIDIRNSFDAPGSLQTNTRLHDHLAGYYKWLDDVAHKYPHTIIENCASGGRRWDLGIAAHTHTSWISDTVNPRYSVQVSYGATLEFAPETCNHWMVGDLGPRQRGGYGTKITSTDPAWWDFLFRVAMPGQTGVSSRLDYWPPEVLERAKQNIAHYKQLRSTIAGADVYHLTLAPDAGYNPTGWMALEFAKPANNTGVLFVYRLGKSKSDKKLLLKGVKPNQSYEVRCDGSSLGTRSGKSLRQDGVIIHLPAEWQSAVIELAATDVAGALSDAPLEIRPQPATNAQP